MSRRSLGSAALAAVLMSSGFLPLLGTANANTCASWTDPKDDATTNQQGHEALRDSNLDIVGVSLTTVGTNVVAAIKVQDLLEGSYSDAGDQFFVQMKTAGTFVKFAAERDELGDTANLANAAGQSNGAASVVFDHVDNTITITATQAEVDKSAGKATAGIVATELSAATYTHVGSTSLIPYDSALAPAATTYTVGAQCSPVIQPLALAFPEGTCNDFTDGSLDGTPIIAADAKAQNEPVLDITSVALNSTPDTFAAYIKVTQLAAKPVYFQGDRFEISFKAGTKTFTFAAGRMGAGKSATPYPTRGQVGGGTNAGLKVRGVFDTAKNTVVILVDRASLNTVNGTAITDGTQVTEVTAKTFGLQPGLPNGLQADTAQATDATARVYTFGGGKCFPPPAGVLTNLGRTTVQYGDAAAVAAKLTSAAGEELSGRTVTFTVGSKSVSAKTNSAGVATASLNPGALAGSYSLVTRFAGDSSVGEVTSTTPFTVTAEKTVLSLRVTKGGTSRTVAATLKDDDKRPVAGQVVTWYVNGKKVSTSRTSSSGVATFKTAKPTQTVKAVFAGVSRKYLGSTAQSKV